MICRVFGLAKEGLKFDSVSDLVLSVLEWMIREATVCSQVQHALIIAVLRLYTSAIVRSNDRQKDALLTAWVILTVVYNNADWTTN